MFPSRSLVRAQSAPCGSGSLPHPREFVGSFSPPFRSDASGAARYCESKGWSPAPPAAIFEHKIVAAVFWANHVEQLGAELALLRRDGQSPANKDLRRGGQALAALARRLLDLPFQARF